MPFTIKDSLDTAGVVTTAGTVGWRDRVPDARRDRRGAAPAPRAGSCSGKTNTPEFTWANETDNDVYGRTSNPYDLEPHARRQQRRLGGDRRGRRLAVRHRQRQRRTASASPRTCAASPGIKPTSGRVPRTGHWPGYEGLFESFTQLGPIARRVEDLALLLPVIAGPDGEDPHVVPVALR